MEGQAVTVNEVLAQYGECAEDRRYFDNLLWQHLWRMFAIDGILLGMAYSPYFVIPQLVRAAILLIAATWSYVSSAAFAKCYRWLGVVTEALRRLETEKLKDAFIIARTMSQLRQDENRLVRGNSTLPFQEWSTPKIAFWSMSSTCYLLLIIFLYELLNMFLPMPSPNWPFIVTAIIIALVVHIALLIYARPKLRRSYDLNRSDVALLVVDMQNDFLDPSSRVGSERKRRALPYVKRLVDFFRDRGLPVIHIITLHDPWGHDWGLLDRELCRPYCIVGTRGAEIVDDLKPLPREPVVVKKRYSGFYHTELDDLLRSIGAKTLVICGVSTDGCVRATALDAYYRDYRVIVPEECVSARDEEAHEESLRFFRKSVGKVMRLNELMAALERDSTIKPSSDGGRRA